MSYGEERLYSDEARNKHLKRQAEAMERAADALELIAGMQMLAFDYDDETPGYTVEALHEEALFHARGGER